MTELIPSATTAIKQSRIVRILISTMPSTSLAVHEKITSCTPVCWNDPLCLRNERRRPLKTTTPGNSPSKDVIELKQAALWHGDRHYISAANDASVDDIVTLWQRSRSRFIKLRESLNLSHPPERPTKQLSLPAYACMSSPSHTVQVDLCAESDSANAGEPIMCSSYCSDNESLVRAQKRRTADAGVAPCHCKRSGTYADQAGACLPRDFRTDAPHDHANLLAGSNDRHGTPEPSVPTESTRAGAAGMATNRKPRKLVSIFRIRDRTIELARRYVIVFTVTPSTG